MRCYGADGTRQCHSQDGGRATLNVAARATLRMAAVPLSRWRLHGGHKMALRGTSSPQKVSVLPPEDDPA
ncbi:hypothetical protein DUI87_21374 [Hirundo rustica rustica]|uniref:Uncharacterized protein n=1 Tax=Hirundo rustica rustica TaxID=333673 RepID=A0A3M0K576_HIRRU|nr:hypothetical protein DUI87_21374 [Hirundo rustica rustica]